MKVTHLQITLVLGVLLLLSIGGNVWQFTRAAVVAATAPLQRKLDTAEITTRIEGEVAAERRADGIELEALRKLWAERPVRIEKHFVDRITKLPVPSCSPGQARVDAWNSVSTEAAK